jgi:hypothetical protein
VTGPEPDGAIDRAVEDELRRLSTAYAFAADAGDGARFAALFVEDGELVVPNFPTDLRPVVTRAGHEALARIPEALGRYDRTFHVVGGAELSVQGDEASGVVQCLAHHLIRGDDRSAGDGRAGTDVVWFIRYRDRYRDTGSGWRFVRRVLHLEWVEERPVSVLGAP